MANTVPFDVTRLLVDWSKGNRAALDELAPLVYQDLHQRARTISVTSGPTTLCSRRP